ncbi:YetF domain-containing protein [Sporosarcina sp. FSL K6-1508]|uniref:YetF domain-containing protein n=1 Tax=Sporosarcina sp. FSL K6-1508 TaxID=2921553 RepID=UPI004040C834
MDDFFEVDFWEMIMRTTVTFIVLLILARFMGKKQISQLTFFHYVTGITIGSIAADIAGETRTPFLDGLVAMIWWAILTMLMSYIAFKSKKARILLDDQPTIVVYEGKIVEQSLKKLRLHLNDLSMMLREQSIFSIKDVHYAILETNGQLSVMKKAGEEPATKKDVNAPAPPPKYIPTEVIAEGKLTNKNLTELNLTEEWLYEQLKKQGIGKVESIFFAEVQTDGSLHIDMKSEEAK